VGRGFLFSVHLLTASGAALALLSALSVVDGNWRAAFVWLGLALVVDGIDGPLARWLRVAERLPQWDGNALDFVIDYTTYVFIPAVILAVGAGLEGAPAVLAGIVVAVSGALYWADTRMKQPDNSFRGFPAVWNMVVFVLFVLSPSTGVTLAVVLLLAALTYAPVNFVHPVRVVKWRRLTLVMLALWLLAGGWLIATNFAEGALVRGVLLVASLYLFSVSAIQQFLRRR
jgi:phosphatidylcholine synthase